MNRESPAARHTHEENLAGVRAFYSGELMLIDDGTPVDRLTEEAAELLLNGLAWVRPLPTLGD
jgi:hypothetical protein